MLGPSSQSSYSSSSEEGKLSTWKNLPHGEGHPRVDRRQREKEAGAPSAALPSAVPS